MKLSDLFTLAASHVRFNGGTCCSAIANVSETFTPHLRREALDFFEKHFKPPGKTPGQYWYGPPKETSRYIRVNKLIEARRLASQIEENKVPDTSDIFGVLPFTMADVFRRAVVHVRSPDDRDSCCDAIRKACKEKLTAIDAYVFPTAEDTLNETMRFFRTKLAIAEKALEKARDKAPNSDESDGHYEECALYDADDVECNCGVLKEYNFLDEALATIRGQKKE